MGRVVIAYENRNTLDGRIMELDSLKPRSDRLPIFYNFSYTTALGWATEFGRWLNPETGWAELSFEMNFMENWGDKIRGLKLIPTIGMSATVIHRTPYDQPDKIGKEKDVISAGEIICVSYGAGLNAWGEIPK